MKRILKIALIAIAVIVVLMVSAFAAISMDAASWTATGSQTLNPSGTSVGKALVVYNPGFSGVAKAVADKIAANLQSDGYTVDLAGVKSAPSDTSNYNVVVVGGPMYFGEATSSIESYLTTMTLAPQAKLGIYVTTGSSQYVDSDYQMLQQQVASAANNRSQVAIGMVLDGNETQNCADLVSALTQ